VLLFAFYYLFLVADEHLSPSLQKISVTFKLSESLTGVTLLAFGAGAPDVFASLSASKDATASGVQMGLSVLLGSSLFILAIATSATLFASPEPIKVKKWLFLRDCFFLIAAEILLGYAIALRGKLDMLMSVTMICLYLVYVVFVIVQDHYCNSQDA
jgi:solute carrier family 24 (sodium/potassium/calcium exchanger), member 6